MQKLLTFIFQFNSLEILKFNIGTLFLYRGGGAQLFQMRQS